MNEEVFTPLKFSNPDVRLEFKMSEVKVISGDLDVRQRGRKAVVEIQGKRYDVFGAPCDIPNCMCDALLREAA